jgi:hypothetical protein
LFLINKFYIYLKDKLNYCIPGKTKPIVRWGRKAAGLMGKRWPSCRRKVFWRVRPFLYRKMGTESDGYFGEEIAELPKNKPLTGLAFLFS